MSGIVEEPLQIVWSGKSLTIGLGLTVMVKFCVGPVQLTWPPVYSGVIVTIDVTGTLPLLTAEKLLMFPFPEAPSPMEGKEFIQV